MPAVRALRLGPAGNLYLHRGITGALVGRQPFGLSGGGSRVGGPDYLLPFLDPGAVTVDTLRRGFAPPPGPPDDGPLQGGVR